jgi:hypothetical protein
VISETTFELGTSLRPGNENLTKFNPILLAPEPNPGVQVFAATSSLHATLVAYRLQRGELAANTDFAAVFRRSLLR